MLWEVVEDRVVGEPKKNDDMRLWGFGFNLFEK